MNAGLTMLGAFLLGLMASGHCLVMCGGISGALALSTQRNAHGRLRWDLLAGYQLGRIGSYMLAALLLAGAGAFIVQLVDQERVRLGLRWLSAALIAAIGVSLLWRGRGFDFTLGRGVWKRLAPLARRCMPVRTLAQALALGAIWGWMPCGLAYSVLLVAWLSMDAWHAAAIMLAFGLGTVPAVLAGAYGAAGGLRLLSHRGLRSAVGALLVTFGTLTALAPWLVAHTGIHSSWFPFDCGIVR
jgi:sulfite exporter TauE/SafE